MIINSWDLAKHRETKHSLEIISPLSFVLLDMLPRCKMPKTKTDMKQSEIFGRRMCARIQKPEQSIYGSVCTKQPSRFRRRACAMFKRMQTNKRAPGFLRSLLCFISFSRSRRFFARSNLWSHYLLTHLSSPKWFLFISCKSPNQSWKLNAIQRSHCFQRHSLSLWKWMAAAENSDVLSHHDRESLNVSCDLYCCCFWLKALVGDLTNHVTHLTPYIWVLYLLCVSLSLLLSVSLACVLLIEIISACWKEPDRREI